MNSKECLDLAILEYEKETVYDENNQWVKNVLKGLKEVKQYIEKLEKERQEIETRLSSNETNTFDEIATMIKKANDYDVLVNKCKQLEKALDILKEVVSLNSNRILETERNLLRLSKEEHELLKEVLSYD